MESQVFTLKRVAGYPKLPPVPFTAEASSSTKAEWYLGGISGVRRRAEEDKKTGDRLVRWDEMRWLDMRGWEANERQPSFYLLTFVSIVLGCHLPQCLHIEGLKDICRCDNKVRMTEKIVKLVSEHSILSNITYVSARYRIETLLLFYRRKDVTWKCCLMGSGIPMVCRLLLGGAGIVVLFKAHSSPISSCNAVMVCVRYFKVDYRA